jgi:hypothetical protein
MDAPVNRCQSPSSTVSPNAVSVAVPRTHSNRATVPPRVGVRDLLDRLVEAGPGGRRRPARRPGPRRRRSAGIVLHELTPVNASLEDAYLALTRDAIEHQATDTSTAPRRAAA